MMKIFQHNFKKIFVSANKHDNDYMPWHERVLRIYERDRSQKFIILFLAMICGVLGYGTIQNKSEVKTVIVRVDDSGNPLSAEVADPQKLPPLEEQEIRRVLANITEWWRIKTTDIRNERRQFSKVFSHMLPAAARKFSNIVYKGNLYPWHEKDITDYEPLTDVGEFTADVEFVSIAPIGASTYQLRYRETAYNKDGTERDQYLLVITYTIGQYAPKKVDDVQRNPYGIFVEDISATIERDLE